MFSFCVCFFMYCSCGKYYKPITLQYYIDDCVRYLGQLWWTYEHWTYERTLGSELVRM